MEALHSARDDRYQGELEELLTLLRYNRLVLPGPPEVANQVRAAAADPATEAGELAQIIGADPALAAHLVKVGNSVSFRRGEEIRSVRAAVTRLGLRLTAMTVTSFSIMQMMATAPGQQARVRALYRHSVAIGQRCFALAQGRRGLLAEDALLLGLVHDIGALPVLQYARQRRLPPRPAELQALIDALHAPVGAELLRRWRFPENLAAAVAVHENWHRDRADGQADYADLLIAANFDLHRGSGHPMAALQSCPPSALSRLGLRPELPLAEQLPLTELAGEVRQLCGADEEPSF